jgi:ribosomal protein L23
MALLGRKKNTAPKADKAAKTAKAKAPAATAETKAVKAAGATAAAQNFAGVLIRPRITEKATVQNERNVYVFEISSRAGKKDVANAIFEAFKVSPIKVGIVRTPAKSVFVRGKTGAKAAIKKAYVYLKDGDKIELV